MQYKQCLLLSPDIDKLFDLKGITFNEFGKLIVGNSAANIIMKKLSIDPEFAIPKNILNKERIYFLAKREKLYYK